MTHTATLSRDDMADRMGPNNIVMSWTKDGKEIVYRSRKQTFNSFIGQLFKVSKDGGMSEELPLPTGGFCSYSPDGSKLAFNRVFREFRTWKYYKGGMADDVWIYDFKSKKTINIGTNVAQDIFPMWIDKEIYFLSDRDRIMNLFVYNTETKNIKKVTDFKEYDIKFPSVFDNEIIFENGGLLYVFNSKTQKSTKVDIEIANDFSYSRDELVDASDYINSMDISPNGERLLIGARGEIFSIPAKNGITRNLTHDFKSHDRDAIWSPDGKNIAYISDKSGEYEIYIKNQNGEEDAIQLTKNGDTYKYHLKWSPDSKKILWSDKMLRLSYVDVESKKITLVEKSEVWEFRNFEWSSDNKWITYTRPESNKMHKVILYNVENKKKTEITKGWYSSGNAKFSHDGKYLIFTSNRDFSPIYSSTEWNHAYSDMSKIYLVTLSKDTKSPFAFENDEITLEEDKKKDEKKDEKKDNDKNKDVKIDIENIQNRIIALPISVGRYWNLYANNDKIFYREYHLGAKKATTKFFDLKSKKETKIGNFDFEVSANGKKFLIIKNNKFSVIDIPSSNVEPKKFVDLSNMKIIVNKKEEWKQIYDESWRQMRDFFYDPNMHGVDWNKMKEKYAKLLPYVNHRNDLNYLIGELIGELSVGHAYVNGGDRPSSERIKLGLLGAKISKDKSGYFKIDEILKGANWSKKLNSPLTKIGLNLKDGDFILEIDGNNLKEEKDIFKFLIGKAGKQIELKVNSKAVEKGSRKIIIKTIVSESELYYYKWVQNNIEKVNKATDGKVGYVHIPDMGVHGLNEFVEHYYPQITKKALIIDDRGNGGGNVSPMIIERLRRKFIIASGTRNVSANMPSPDEIFIGPKVLLINNYSASDGDLFPFRFKAQKMGKVIGVRSWGGVVGIRGSLPFVDGGDLRKPEFGHFSTDGSKWEIEGYGIDPDIIIDNDPAKEYQGEDQQLNKAIEVIMEEMKNFKIKVHKKPPFPKK
ncbi:MAG: protease [Bacteroidetes bacterium 4572_128]|nr:MAG: protease [Bacteroidetes bacterium 4572_128]